jgi:hypothetical protein
VAVTHPPSGFAGSTPARRTAKKQANVVCNTAASPASRRRQPPFPTKKPIASIARTAMSIG